MGPEGVGLMLLKFINGKIENVSIQDACLGIRFWPDHPEFSEREEMARMRAYGPLGSSLRERDLAFRKKWNIDE